MKRKVYLILLGIIVLAFLAGSLAYPKPVNEGVDFLNEKLGFVFPHFWDIPFKLGLDLQGGTHLLYEADLSGVEKDNYDSAMQGLRDIIERRVNMFGVAEPIVQTQQAGETYRLVVELAGIKDPAQAIQMIGKTPFLEFREQKSQEDRDAIIAKQKEIQDMTLEEAQQVENWQLAFEDPNFQSTPLTGQYLDKANIVFNQQTGDPLITLDFDTEGADLFAQLTEKNVGKILAIYIDGTAISTPVVNEKITGGSAQITGKFGIEEAKDLARNLNAGALPVPINLISQQSVGPTLGSVSLQQSLKAGLMGFLIVVIFLILFYRIPGLLASLSLGIYVVLIISLFKLIPVTLTLAGIGGFILSIGMAVDANILIFSRMREELKREQSFSVSIEEGFRRSWPSIRDGNLTTLIVALILFTLGTSFIKGFALTLSIGIIVSMFSAIFITRNLLRLFVNTKLEKIKFLWK
ncbi:protein translocase subunit SecD [Patescibacteria group bacterium]|nr:protein translocase subunit SecD [Patescibacteria group bacterium]